MSTRYLAIDKDEKFHNKQSAAWVDKGISSLRVDTMDEGISCAKKEEFMFIAINSDNIEYLSKLRDLKNVTNSRILIATSRFTMKEHTAAMNNGADAFGYIGEPEENVESVKAIIKNTETRKYSTQKISEKVVHGNIFILPNEGKAYIDEVNISLTKLEIRLMCLLINGNGRMFTYDEIYNNVYYKKKDYDIEDSVKAVVKRIRKKFGNSEVIRTIRGKGYQIGN